MKVCLYNPVESIWDSIIMISCMKTYKVTVVVLQQEAAGRP